MKDGFIMPFKDPEAGRVYRHNYYLAHKEAKKAYRRQYYLSNTEWIKKREANYLKLHRAAANARAVARDHANPTLANARRKRYEQSHPEAGQVRSALHRARKRSLPNTLTVAEWKAIKAAYKHRCAYCGKPNKRLTQDHVVPLSKAGGTVIGNIVPACQRCNSRKGTSPPAVPFVKLLLL